MKYLNLPLKLALFFILGLKCTEAEEYVKTGLGITSIPTDIPSGCTRVDLSQNALYRISDTDFDGMTSLEYLDLRENNINSISQNAFSTNPLKKLYLSNNPIQTIPFFTNLENTLQGIYLQGCEIATDSCDGVVHYRSLLTFDAASNSLTTIPDLRMSSAKLKTLLMSKNLIETVNATMFDGFTSLNEINLMQNMIHAVYGVLNIPALFNLNLAKNNISMVNDNLFKNTILIKKLFMQSNKLVSPPKIDAFKQALILLSLSQNQIPSIPLNYFQSCPNLKQVILSSNLLTEISWASHFGPSLEKLDVTANDIAGIVPSDAFPNATGLTKLSMGTNKITKFDMSNLNNMPRLQILDLKSNKITELQDPYPYCPGTNCENLIIKATNNDDLQCDYRLCWAKTSTKIALELSSCTISSLNCQAMEVMKVKRSGDSFAYYEKTTLPGSSPTKLKYNLPLLKCAAECRKMTNCQFFKHIKNATESPCSIWTT